MHFFHTIHIDDRRPVNPRELLRVERRLEARHRLAIKMLLAPRMQADVVPRRLDPVELFNPQKENAPA